MEMETAPVHVLLFPWPAQGHINCMLHFAAGLLDAVPGMEGFLRRRDLPTSCRRHDVDPMLQILAEFSAHSSGFHGVLVRARQHRLRFPVGAPSEHVRGEPGAQDVDVLQKAVEAAGSSGKGRVVEWAPQRDVMRHRALGCFLTHAGWNSTLEGVVEGVPMVCWPFFVDQHINSRFVGAVWRTGLDMKGVCERTVVEKMVREAMAWLG
ncbi:hypothetical protein ACQ4PT_036299 [Festuca glaucescens]